jgi:hypothetical protein
MAPTQAGPRRVFGGLSGVAEVFADDPAGHSGDVQGQVVRLTTAPENLVFQER